MDIVNLCLRNAGVGINLVAITVKASEFSGCRIKTLSKETMLRVGALPPTFGLHYNVAVFAKVKNFLLNEFFHG